MAGDESNGHEGQDYARQSQQPWDLADEWGPQDRDKRRREPRQGSHHAHSTLSQALVEQEYPGHAGYTAGCAPSQVRPGGR